MADPKDIEAGHSVFHHVAPQHSIKANPAPLGLLCFGMTTCMLMFIDTEWAAKPFVNTVLGYAMIYGGATQLIVGLMEYVRGNGFGGAAFSSYGCFWLGYFINSVLAKQKITGPPDETGEILWFVLWGVLTFCFFLFSLRKPITLQAVFSTLTVTFFLLAAGVKNHNCRQAGGYWGFVCASSAIYAAFAELAEEELGLSLPGTQVWWPKTLRTPRASISPKA